MAVEESRRTGRFRSRFARSARSLKRAGRRDVVAGEVGQEAAVRGRADGLDQAPGRAGRRRANRGSRGRRLRGGRSGTRGRPRRWPAAGRRRRRPSRRGSRRLRPGGRGRRPARSGGGAPSASRNTSSRQARAPEPGSRPIQRIGGRTASRNVETRSDGERAIPSSQSATRSRRNPPRAGSAASDRVDVAGRLVGPEPGGRPPRGPGRGPADRGPSGSIGSERSAETRRSGPGPRPASRRPDRSRPRPASDQRRRGAGRRTPVAEDPVVRRQAQRRDLDRIRQAPTSHASPASSGRRSRPRRRRRPRPGTVIDLGRRGRPEPEQILDRATERLRQRQGRRRRRRQPARLDRADPRARKPRPIREVLLRPSPALAKRPHHVVQPRLLAHSFAPARALNSSTPPIQSTARPRS